MKKFLTTLLSAMITLIAANAQVETPKQYTVDGFTFEFQHDNNFNIDNLVLIDAKPAIQEAINNETFRIKIPESIFDENGNKITVDEIGIKVFHNIEKIQEIILPDCIKKIWYTNFNNCPDLTNIYLGKSLEVVQAEVFVNLPKLKSLTFPESIESIKDESVSALPEVETIILPESLRYIGAYCFLGLQKVHTIEFKTSDIHIDRYSFRNIPLLTKLEFPKKYRYPIYTKSFLELQSLKEVILPEWIDIESIDIPIIGLTAFSNCPSIEKIISLSSIPPPMVEDGIVYHFGEDPYPTGGTLDRQKCTLYVPKGSLQAYRDDPSWGSFPNIEEYEPASVEQIFEDNNADVMPGVIQTRNGEIILRDFGNANISIFSADARLHYNGNVTDTEISLPSGIYIVACGNARMKVSL